MRPTDLKTNDPVKIKVPKRGRPPKICSKLTSNEEIQVKPLKPHNIPENVIILIFQLVLFII